MIIQNNIPALNSRRAFDTNNSKLSKSLEKLSSGYSVNRAADDSAGLAVSEKMRSQIFGIRQSVRNTQDGVSLIQTFEGALNETVSIIKRAKGLAVQSANGSYDDGIDRNAIEIEYLHLCDEVTHIAGTDFNGIVMLSDREIASKLAEIEKKIDTLTVNLSKYLPAVMNEPADSPQSVSAKSAYAAPKAGGVTCGDFTVYGDSGDFSFDEASGVLTISGGDVTVEGTGKTTKNSIVVQKDQNASVTLRNVNISTAKAAFMIEDNSKGNVNVILEGSNSLISGSNHAGLQKNCGSVNPDDYGTLTISGSGSLDANFSSSGDGAGIGGQSGKNSCNIIIESGTIAAKGVQSAGIGGGSGSSGVNIVINGGDITAKSVCDAGIGGGVSGSGIGITINGGTVTATGGNDGGAGIGGGLSGKAQNITINGGTVIASSESNGAGIGGGRNNTAINIVINGGTVIAKGGNISPTSTAIGSGGNSSGSSITINGGTVTAIGGSSATKSSAGIGGNNSIVKINGKDTVVMAKGGENAEDIGSSNIQFKSTVIIGEDLISEPFTGGEITDGTIVHNKDDAINPIDPDPPQPVNPDPPQPDNPGSPTVSVSDAFNNASAKLTYADNLILQVGPRSKDAVNFTFKYPNRGIGSLNADLNCTAKGLGMDKLTLKTQKSANYAVDQLDYALNKVTKIRTVFGAAQNRLEHKIDNLNNILENLTSAESGIRDTDMAEEIMNFTKDQIVSQASQSMLAQANSLPQQVLNLIGQ